MRDLGTPKLVARKRMRWALALPSTGGAVMRILMELPCSPTISSLLARGCTRTLSRSLSPCQESGNGALIARPGIRHADAGIDTGRRSRYPDGCGESGKGPLTEQVIQAAFQVWNGHYQQVEHDQGNER